jgi:DNA-binding transcriptional ArsR family regulator
MASKPSVVVLATPLGETIGHLEPAIAKYSPDVLLLFTNMNKPVENVRKHLAGKWSTYCKRPVDVQLVPINEPWRQETIQEYMQCFDQKVEDLRTQYPGCVLQWKVSIVGGTNLMCIASALSATNHTFPVYYTVPAEHYPDLSLEDLLIEIPLFANLGPAMSLFRKRAKREVFEHLRAEGPMSVSELAEKRETSPQSVYKHIQPMVAHGMVEVTEDDKRKVTPFGLTAYHRAYPEQG